jgi:hypothetical protein
MPDLIEDKHYWLRFDGSKLWDVMVYRDGIFWDHEDRGFSPGSFTIGPIAHEPGSPENFDAELDEIDGILFRFWIRAAAYPGGWSSDLMRALTHCTTANEYRMALMKLAHDKGVNLPIPEAD